MIQLLTCSSSLLDLWKIKQNNSSTGFEVVVVWLLLKKLHLSKAYLVSLRCAVKQIIVKILFVVSYRGFFLFSILKEDINKCKHGSY